MTKASDRELASKQQITTEQLQILREMRSLTDDGIRALPEKAMRSSMRRIDFPDMPRQRQAFRLAQAGVSSQAERSQVLQRALRQLDSIRLRAPLALRAGLPTGGPTAVPLTAVAGPMVPMPTAGLTLRHWQSLGPGNIGGRTRAIVIHPTSPATIWIGAAGGGVWRTDDAGQNWAPVDDFMDNLAVTSLVMDPTDPNVIYAGTGEGFGNADSLRGAGVFATGDGITWRQIAATDTADFHRVNRLAISADGGVLLAATNLGIFRSDEAARLVWTRVLGAPVADVKCHPTDPDHAVAGSVDSGQVWRTKDGGVTWKPATHSGFWNDRVEVCYAAADPDIVYASVNVNRGEIWRSTNGGARFSRRKSRNANNAPANFLGDQGWYDNVIWAGDPTDADLVIAGGIDLWRSTDGGDRLSEISTWWDSASAHADQHAIVAHPGYDGTTNRIIYFGNDGGIYRTDDVTTVGNEPVPPKVSGWVNLNNSYGVTQFYGGAVNPTTGVIVCGAQDNGTLAYHPGAGQNGWTAIFGGDGGFCAADPGDPNVFYGEYVYLNIHRNMDGAATDDTMGDRYISGQFWNPVIGRWDWKQPPFRIPDAFNQRALFIAPFALDQSNPDRLFAGGESLWRTEDAKAPNTTTSGPQWVRIKPPANGLISAVTIDPSDSEHVWVGYTSGELCRSLNATAANPSWTRLDGQGPQPVDVSRYVHQITVSPHVATRCS